MLVKVWESRSQVPDVYEADYSNYELRLVVLIEQIML